MNKHVANACYGVLDYVTYPAAMLASAPFVLRALGTERYGVWMIANSVAVVGGVIASGLGDANIRMVAAKDEQPSGSDVIAVVENMVGLHLVLGIAVAAIACMLCPWIAVRSSPQLYGDCLLSLRLACVLVFLRAIETVWVSTLRAHSLYGRAFAVTGVCRLMSVASAVVLPMGTQQVSAILGASVLICASGLVAQRRQVGQLLNVARVRPRFDRAVLDPILSFGMHTWILSVAGLLFTQVDRVMVGMFFGAAQVTAYAICAQLTQPIYGIAAAGLHFVFPYIAAQTEEQAIRSSILRAAAVNFAFAVGASALLLMCGRAILTLIGGQAMALKGAQLLPILACASALSSMSITGAYAMLACGRSRTVALFGVAGAVVAAVALPLCADLFGVAGLAYARIAYGVVAVMIYLPLSWHSVRRAGSSRGVVVSSWEDA